MNDSSSLAMFFAAWDLFADPAVAGLIAGAMLGMLGVYVVLRRMVFLSAALSQVAGFGVALAFYVHVAFDYHGPLASPAGFASTLTLLAALLLASDRLSLRGRRDSLLGLVYLAGSAGALALGTRIVEEVRDIHALLFGSAVAVSASDFALVTWLAAGVGALHLWWMRGFILISFDRDGARVRGLPVRLLDTALLSSIAIAISLCTRVLGALPVFAFSVLPAMAAIQLGANVPRALALAAVFGGASGFGGYLAAFVWQLPVGASQALVAAVLVLLTSLVRRAA